MNELEYNQTMIDYLNRVHGNCMGTVLMHDKGYDTRYAQHDEIRRLVGRETVLAAQEAEAAIAHANRFNHVLNQAARLELFRRKVAKRKAEKES